MNLVQYVLYEPMKTESQEILRPKNLDDEISFVLEYLKHDVLIANVTYI